MDEKNQEEKIDNSRLEEILKKEITPAMQIEFFAALKDSQLYLPVRFSLNMFEAIEDAKPGDVFETNGQAGFDINYLTNAEGQKAVPLFTSDEVMKQSGLESSVMVMYAEDIAGMLKQTDRYSVIAINPFTEYEIFMPIEAYLSFFE